MEQWTAQLEHVDKVRMAIVKSPSRSVRRYSTASVQRVLHRDLNFHSYKIAIVQELSDCDMTNCIVSSEQLIEVLNDDGVTNKIIATGHLKIHKSSISVLSTVED
jgi:hypothetical protein